MLVMIDNYDSFTYNLVQYFGELGADIQIFRNDEVDVNQIATLQPDHIVISPGPGRPDQAGISSELIRALGPSIPTLGVCLGHQCIGEVFGGQVIRAARQMHGKTSMIHHQDDALFADVPSDFPATRYHSLIVDAPSLPESLQVIASTAQGEIMALRHRTHPIWGVQFHPESILTPHGKQMLDNFLHLSAEAHHA